MEAFSFGRSVPESDYMATMENVQGQLGRDDLWLTALFFFSLVFLFYFPLSVCLSVLLALSPHLWLFLMLFFFIPLFFHFFQHLCLLFFYPFYHPRPSFLLLLLVFFFHSPFLVISPEHFFPLLFLLPSNLLSL